MDGIFRGKPGHFIGDSQSSNESIFSEDESKDSIAVSRKSGINADESSITNMSSRMWSGGLMTVTQRSSPLFNKSREELISREEVECSETEELFLGGSPWIQFIQSDIQSSVPKANGDQKSLTELVKQFEQASVELEDYNEERLEEIFRIGVLNEMKAVEKKYGNVSIVFSVSGWRKSAFCRCL